MKIWRLAFAMLAAFSLASCSSDDDDKDITKEIIMNVSAEPGVMYALFDSMGEHPIECMQVMTEDEPGQWQHTCTSVKSRASLMKEVMNTCCA